MESDNPHTNGQKSRLHPAAGRGYGGLGLDVRSGAGRDLRLRRPRVPCATLCSREPRSLPDTALRVTRRTLLVGGGVGLVLAVGYLFQTLGLLYTTPTNSGLITGLFVVFAPVAD